MGCTSSKVDESPAVVLCRERCDFLDEAIKQRFALAEAHTAYTYSLRQIGPLIHHFMQQQNSINGWRTPELNLPPEVKGDSGSPKKAVVTHRRSHSGSSSHLNFDSDSEDDEEGSGLLHHSDHSVDSSPLHDHIDSPASGFPRNEVPYADPDQVMYPERFMRMNFMKRNVIPPSVAFHRRPVSPGRVYYVGEPSTSSSSSYPYPYPYPGNRYVGYSDYDNGYGTAGGYSTYGLLPAQASSKPPPPPPSPPRASAWEYLNLFQGYEQLYPLHISSRDSEELGDEENIPHLEDDDIDQEEEAVKEVRSDKKSNHLEPAVNEHHKPAAAAETGSHGGDSETSLHETSSSVSVDEDERLEYEIHGVEKRWVEDERKEEEVAGGGTRDVLEVAKEIELQFLRASDSGNEIAKMLEVGKLPYKRKHASSKMSNAAMPLLPMLMSSDKAGTSDTQSEGDVSMKSRNLSSTLHRLYLWEKKLYQEVKAEEKLRVLYDRKFRRLKQLGDTGAEPQKISSTRALVKSLSTKLRFAVRVVDKISVTISKIRDEELWPQLNELIQGLIRMWKSMLGCHHSQCQAIREASGSLPMRSNEKHTDSHPEATHRLENELVNWTIRFSLWISAQKGYVRALNSWLLKCLLYEPEETPDGIAPFSPGRIGAPLIFVICNQWSQAMERVSEKEVIDSMRNFTMRVLQLREQDRLEMRQNMMEKKDYAGRGKNFEKEDQRIHKEIQALEKRMVLASGDSDGLPVSEHVVYQSDASDDTLQGHLQRIFEAMERFTADSLKVYEELLLRAEEEKATRETEGSIG